jgi:hypothetical protein
MHHFQVAGFSRVAIGIPAHAAVTSAFSNKVDKAI